MGNSETSATPQVRPRSRKLRAEFQSLTRGPLSRAAATLGPSTQKGEFLVGSHCSGGAAGKVDSVLREINLPVTPGPGTGNGGFRELPTLELNTEVTNGGSTGAVGKRTILNLPHGPALEVDTTSVASGQEPLRIFFFSCKINSISMAYFTSEASKRACSQQA